MTAAAVAAAGLPALVLPEKSIFLPPTGGWFQTPLRMREVRQYCINNDSMPMRYDVVWGVEQWHVDFPEISWSLEKTDPRLFAELLEHQRSIARQTFENIQREKGFRRSDLKLPPLPRWAKSNPDPKSPWDNDVLARYV